MSTQPEALRLAYLLEVSSDNPTLINVDKRCAAELRRLHALCEEMQSELFAYRASKYLKDVTAALKSREALASSVATSDTSQERVDETAKQRHEQEPWPDEPAGHMAGGVQPSKMTKSKAITAIYALFNAPHNADINLTGLNKVLDELMVQPEQDYRAMYLKVRDELAELQQNPPHRKPLSDVEIWNTYKNLWMFHPAEEPRLAGDILKFARAIEAKLKEKNT